MKIRAIGAGVMSLALGGCAQLQFGKGSADDGVNFFDPVPYLFVSVDEKCAATASVVTLPGRPRNVKFIPGLFGSSALTVNIEKGQLTSVGQTSDSGASDAITALTGLATAAALFPVANTPERTTQERTTQHPVCPDSALFPIDENGSPDFSRPKKPFLGSTSTAGTETPDRSR